MKKFLSLVLALVMTMSLVTISAGAKDFDDNGDIDYKEAVDVISALGIVDGYSDGSFRPDGSLTRGAAAKIICNLILGPTTASALSATTAPFKDVPTTNTFAGYITYCAQQGIISGYGDGTFRPTGSLTGNAFLKMLLGALGYDSSIEGYTGSNWQVNVTKQAVGIGLNKGNDDFVGSKTVTRQEACLYAFNMLKSDMVQYDSKTTVDINGATVTIAGDKAKAVSTANGWVGTNDGNIDRDGVQQFAEKYFDKLTRTRNDTDAFGRPANEWKYRSEIIGSYTDYSDLQASYEGTKAPMGELYSLIGGSIVDELTPAGNRDGEYSFTVYVDGEEVDDPVVGNYFVKNSSAAAGTKNAIGKGNNVGQSGNGVLTEVFMDDDNNVTITMVNTYLVQATADYNSTRENITVEPKTIDSDTLVLPNMDTTISQDDFDVSGVKADDYLLVTWSYKDDEYVSVEPATMKVGEVSKYTIRDNVVVDGETLKYNKLVGTTEQEEEFSINSQASLVLDQYGYIIYVDDANSTSSYVYIQDVAGSTQLKKTAVGAAYFTDGTYDEINIKKVIDAQGDSHTSAAWMLDTANGGADPIHGWFTFTKTEGGDYTLTAADRSDSRDIGVAKNTKVTANTDPAPQIVYNNRVHFIDGTTMNSSTVGTGAAAQANENTIFLVLDSDDEVYAYTGVSNVPNVSIGGGSKDLSANAVEINYVEKGGYAQYVFIDVSADEDANIDDVTSIADYMLLLKNNGKKTVEADDTYYQYDVILDGEVTTKYIAESLDGITADKADSGVGNLYYSIKTNSKGYITDSTKRFKDGVKDEFQAFTLTNATISQKGQTITFNPGFSYLVDSNTEIYLAINKGCALLNDSGADYETYVKTTIGTIAGLCTGYDVGGKVYAVLDDDVGKTDGADYLFVWIDDATPNNLSTVPAPAIATQPAATTSVVEGAAVTLGVSATGSNLTYQWYSNTTNSTTGGTAIPGATAATYTPSTASVGTTYYYCVVTSQSNNYDIKTNTTTSNVAEVKVNAYVPQMKVNVYYTTDGKLTGYVSEETLTLNAPVSGTVVSVTRGNLTVPTGYEVTSGVPQSYIFTNGATETLYVTVAKTATLNITADSTIFPATMWTMGTPSKTTNVKAGDEVTVTFTQVTPATYDSLSLTGADCVVTGGTANCSYALTTHGVIGGDAAVITLTIKVTGVTGDTLEITAK